MRADKALMLGVGALGLFAVYRMVTAKAQEEAPSPTPGLLPGLPPLVPNQQNGTGLLMLGDPLQLQKGQFYRARMLVVGTSPPFSNLADEVAIGQGLVVMGFADVRVFMGLQDLPGDWPASTTTAPVPGTRWFQGIWQGPSVVLPRPLTIQAMWPSPNPTPVSTSGRG